MRNNLSSRREFVAGAAMTAAAYAQARAQVRGANDRLRIAIVGPGSRGTALMRDFYQFAQEMNAEMVAVCDLWSKRQDQAAARVKEMTGREPRKVQHIEDVLQMNDVDAVIIATPDFAHAKLLTQAVKAGKDVYCEKPMGNVLAEVKEAYRTVKASKQVVQIGTQGLSTGNYQAAAQFVRSGKLGVISKVVLETNYNGPRWRGVPAVKEIQEQDTDWNAWLLGRPPRPFDPRLYFEFRLYQGFSSGIPDQWMSHAIAGVHHVMDDYFPHSVVANAGAFVWKDERENPDTFQALLVYPKGFMVSYSTMFGNDSPAVNRYYGLNGTMEETGRESYVVKGVGGDKRPARISEEITLQPINPVH
ncbi:MAG: Gfo/Idh/MocA family oxidoreductase, partial [Acidobacteria bacterium]|nr:Gfo/Idh/MocA family oxidoreductase [Acidobacteriota bacterium]